MRSDPGTRAVDPTRTRPMARARHGNSPAAWVTVGLVLACQVGCAVAVVLARPTLFWGFGVAMVVALGVGKLLSMAGLGALPTYRQTEPVDSVLEGPDLAADRTDQRPTGSRSS